MPCMQALKAQSHNLLLFVSGCGSNFNYGWQHNSLFKCLKYNPTANSLQSSTHLISTEGGMTLDMWHHQLLTCKKWCSIATGMISSPTPCSLYQKEGTPKQGWGQGLGQSHQFECSFHLSNDPSNCAQKPGELSIKKGAVTKHDKVFALRHPGNRAQLS